MLEMNPFVDVHVHPAPDVGPIEVITVRAPVRGRGLLVRELTRADGELFAFFAALVASGGEADLDSDAAIVDALVDLGFLVTADHVVAWPQYRVGSPASGPPVPFALPPGIAWPSDYDEQASRLRAFADGPVTWVGDASTLLSPYWGAIGEAAARDAARFARFASHRDEFAADEVAVVRDFLGPDELTSLRAYYAELLAAGLVPLGDRQNRARFSIYNDPIGRFVHARYAAAFSSVAGQPLIPSFSYFFSYLPGAALEPHKDRAQAAFSISLQLDRDTPWPLDFTFDDGHTRAALLSPGDAVLYHGRAVMHSRSVFTGTHCSVLVLEYVPRDFKGLLI